MPAPYRRLGRAPPTRAVSVKLSPRCLLAAITTRRLRVNAAVNRHLPDASRRDERSAFAKRLDCGGFSAAFPHHHRLKIRLRKFLNRHTFRCLVPSPSSSFNVRMDRPCNGVVVSAAVWRFRCVIFMAGDRPYGLAVRKDLSPAGHINRTPEKACVSGLRDLTGGPFPGARPSSAAATHLSPAAFRHAHCPAIQPLLRPPWWEWSRCDHCRRQRSAGRRNHACACGLATRQVPAIAQTILLAWQAGLRHADRLGSPSPRTRPPSVAATDLCPAAFQWSPGSQIGCSKNELLTDARLKNFSGVTSHQNSTSRHRCSS